MAIDIKPTVSDEAKRKPRKAPRTGRAGVASRKIDDLADLIPHRLVAAKLGVTTDTLREWVGKGDFPEPHSIFQQTWLYRVDHVRAFLETGKWPDGTKFKMTRARWDD
jgi:hypothetical protein